MRPQQQTEYRRSLFSTAEQILGNQRCKRSRGRTGRCECESPDQHSADRRRLARIAPARGNRTVDSLGWQARRLVLALPDEESQPKRDIEQRRYTESRLRAECQHHQPADRRAEAARQVVADRAQPDGGRKMLFTHLFTDRSLP